MRVPATQMRGGSPGATDPLSGGAGGTVRPAGPPAAGKALALGADRGVLVSDERLHGSDAMATAHVLAKALGSMEFDLVLMGSESTDARTSLVPQALAQHLDLPGLTNAKKVEVDGS